MNRICGNDKLNTVTHGRGYVYLLQYHIVWVTKYRKPIFTDNIEIDVKTYLVDILKSLDMDIIAMEVIARSYTSLSKLQTTITIIGCHKNIKG